MKICYLIEIIDNIMRNLIQYEFNIVIMGDLNVNFLKRNELIDFLDINGLSNLVHNATCFKVVPSVIDLVITNKPKGLKSQLVLILDLVTSIHSCVQQQGFKYQNSNLTPLNTDLTKILVTTYFYRFVKGTL